MPMDLDSIGQTIRMLRKNKGFTQEQLAEASEHHPVYISQIERGVKIPSMESVGKLARALDITPEELLYLSFSSEDESGDLRKQIIGLIAQQDTEDLKTLHAIVQAFVKAKSGDKPKT